MARFAHDCLIVFDKTTKRMEVALGPDTGELGLRVGLHSGPVTAGVLRGERARFQLYVCHRETIAALVQLLPYSSTASCSSALATL